MAVDATLARREATIGSRAGLALDLGLVRIDSVSGASLLPSDDANGRRL